MDFTFIQYIEGPFSEDKDFKILAENGKEIQFQMIPEFKCRKESDVAGCQITFSFHKDGKQLMLFGFVVNVVIKDFGVFLKTIDNTDALAEYLKPLWVEVLKFTRGVLAAKLYATNFSNFFLPVINPDSFKFIITEEDPVSLKQPKQVD